MEILFVGLIILTASLIPTTIKTEITIRTDRDKIMKNLKGFELYDEWNPFIVHINGKPEIGETLHVTIKTDKKKTILFNPTVLHSDKNGFCWRGSIGMRFIFDGTHCFKVKKIDSDNIVFLHSETFQGILVWPMIYAVKQTKQNFEKMNKALKQRVEL